MLKHKAISC